MFGHPAGLTTLFFTELWERLSYYGMRALLVLFLTAQMSAGGFGMSAETAGAIYGLYTALVYLAALPGGWVADRLLGLRQAVFVGGCVIAAGHFSMAVPTVPTFYLGLALIIIGTGLLKPNISALVGELYPEGGARRDAGFSVYYMGINLGAFLGPLVCGGLGEKVNWHLGFGAAGVGMVLGVIQYRFGCGALGDAGARKAGPVGTTDAALRQLGIGIQVFLVLGLLIWGVKALNILPITLPGLAKGLGGGIVGLALVYFAWLLLSPRWTTTEKKRIVVIICLFFGAAMFWSGFEQAGSSMNLFAKELTNLNCFGWTAPASWLQSVNPILIILLAPVFGWLWVWLAHREPSIPTKFAAGLLLLGTGFLVLAWGSTFASAESKVSPMWLIVTYFLHTSGELCLSPVGLSSVTKLAPKPLSGQMMGVWFMGAALGNLVAGLLGGLFETLPLPQLFGAAASTAVGAGLLFLLFRPVIKRLIGNLA